MIERIRSWTYLITDVGFMGSVIRLYDRGDITKKDFSCSIDRWLEKGLIDARQYGMIRRKYKIE